jgi:hypothetical protein
MADEQARKDAALQGYRAKLLQHKARARRPSVACGANPSAFEGLVV